MSHDQLLEQMHQQAAIVRAEEYEHERERLSHRPRAVSRSNDHRASRRGSTSNQGGGDGRQGVNAVRGQGREGEGPSIREEE